MVPTPSAKKINRYRPVLNISFTTIEQIDLFIYFGKHTCKVRITYLYKRAVDKFLF